MFRRLLFIGGVVLLAGCATVQVPNYIKDAHPYTRKVYGDFGRIVTTVKKVLQQEGWAIQRIVEPSVYERNVRYDDKNTDNILILTEVRQTPMILFSRYSHLNVYVYQEPGGAFLDLRYGAQTPVLIKKFNGFRNDRLSKRILDLIEKEMLLSP